MSSDTESTFVHHEPCPKCGSSNALARYSDGHAHCFKCSAYEPGEGSDYQPKERRMAAEGLIEGLVPKALVARKISEETCQKWRYAIGIHNGKTVQIANYCDDTGHTVAQKVRGADKSFFVTGDLKAATPLYGQWLWRDKGKKVVITEGEIDALTVSQLQGNKWPVVSVPNGAHGAAKAIAAALEWLMNFEQVVFMFDMDAPGREAAEECAALLPPGRAAIASLPLKDASECLQQGQGEKVIQAMWDAKVWRPDGIVNGATLWADVEHEDKTACIAFGLTKELEEKTRGLRKGEVIMITAGSGIGKSAIAKEVAHHVLLAGHTLGMLMLEEPIKRTALGMMSISANHPLHLDRTGVDPEAIKAAFDATLGTGRLFLYDHFGSTGKDNLMSKLRYLAKGCGCDVLVLDHLSIVVSGDDNDDERKLIDQIMTALATLANECDVAIIAISHLRRPSGDKGHEEGAATSLSQLRGSHAIAQLSHTVIGAERDQQGGNPLVTMLRVLKCRFTGETGIAGYLAYDRKTGRLTETEAPKACPFPSTGGAKTDDEF